MLEELGPVAGLGEPSLGEAGCGGSGSDVVVVVVGGEFATGWLGECCVFGDGANAGTGVALGCTAAADVVVS